MGLTKDLGALPRVLTVSGSNVGVGTTTPTTTLDVTGTGRFSAALTTNGGIFIPSTSRIQFDSGVTNDYNISKQGNVLIFNTGGTYQFNAGVATFSSSVTANSYTISSGGNNSVLSFLNNASSGARSISYVVATAAINVNDVNGNPLVTFLNGGNVGIGTTNPGSRLEVFGGNILSRANIAYGPFGPDAGVNLTLTNTSTSTANSGVISFNGHTGNAATPYQMGYISAIKDTTIGDGSYASSLVFWTVSGGANGEANSGGYRRMVITGAGNVGIGTTVPKNTLQVSTPGSGASLPTLGNITNSTSLYLTNNNFGYGMLLGSLSSGNTWIQSQRTDASAVAYDLLLQPVGGNVGVGTTSAGNKLTVGGAVQSTHLVLTGNYNINVTTDSNWSSYQNIINPGILETGVTYMIAIRWNYSEPGNQPYFCYCSFLWQGAFTNGGSTDNEFTPICSTHTGGTGSNISFRSIGAVGGSTSGIQARLNSFPTRGGVMTIKATRLE